MYKSLRIFLILFATVYMECAVYEKITYLAVEHANVTYFNKKYIGELSTYARRYSRSDPIYYYNMNMTWLVGVGNNLTLDFYFYEWLTNQYKRTFVEMHFKGCNMINNNAFFGATMKKAFNDLPCPYPPNRYVLMNMTVPPEAIPRSFPFTKGRIYCNSSWDTGELVGSGYVNMELRTMKRKIGEKN